MSPCGTQMHEMASKGTVCVPTACHRPVGADTVAGLTVKRKGVRKSRRSWRELRGCQPCFDDALPWSAKTEGRVTARSGSSCSDGSSAFLSAVVAAMLARFAGDYSVPPVLQSGIGTKLKRILAGQGSDATSSRTSATALICKTQRSERRVTTAPRFLLVTARSGHLCAGGLPAR
jgi:hypothetical protein